RAANNYFGVAADYMPLLHTWSLAVEEQFYIFFPPLLAFIFRWGRRTVIWLLVAASVVSLIVAEGGVRLSPSGAFYLAPPRAWELGIGALLALGAVRGTPPAWLREAAAALGLAAILAAVFLYDKATPFPGIAALAPCLGTAAIIWAGGHGSTLTSRLLSLPFLIWFGLISYSLYLWHWPIFAFVRLRLDQTEMPVEYQVPAIAVAVLLGWLSWRFVEAPFRKRADRGGRFDRRAIFALSGGSMAAVVVVAGGIWAAGGAPIRFSPAVLAAESASRDVNPDRDRCFDRDPSVSLCVFPTGVEAKPSFLFWGDSHAEAMMPGVAAAAREAGVVGFFAGTRGCPPLLGLDRRLPNQEFSCADFNEDVLDFLRSRENVRVVVLAGRWPFVATGALMPEEPVFGTPLFESGKEPSDDPETNRRLFEEGLSRTIYALREAGRQVVILGSTPEIGWNVPKRLTAELRFDEPAPTPPSRGEVVARQASAEAVLSSIKGTNGVEYLPLLDRFCDERCRIELDGRPLYFDDDHLSAYGAERMIAPLLVPRFADLVAQSKR
ncbi:MAG: acyltransferase family protein, partial [Pseudomonadota bacterium]